MVIAPVYLDLFLHPIHLLRILSTHRQYILGRPSVAGLFSDKLRCKRNHSRMARR